MALLFSEAFETTALVKEFFPDDLRPSGSFSTSSSAPTRTNSYLTLGNGPTHSLLGFRFGTALGAQTGKKLFFGFATRCFDTVGGTRNGTITTRAPFVDFVDAAGDIVLSFAFEKELDSDPNRDVFKLAAVQNDTVIARYPLPDLQTFLSSGTLLLAHALAGTSAHPNWVYFEWEIDLSIATPTVRFFMNGYPLTDTVSETDLAFTVTVPFSALGGLNFYGANDTGASIAGYSNNPNHIDDFYVADDQQEAVHYPETAILSRLGPVRVYTTTYLDSGGVATNWTRSGAASNQEALSVEDGDTKYLASNTLNAQLATRINGPGALSSFEKVAGVQMIYSARSAGALDTAITPTVQDATNPPVEYYSGAAPTIFPGGAANYATKIVTLQTDPVAAAAGAESVAFSPTDLTTSNDTRRIGLRLDAVPSTP